MFAQRVQSTVGDIHRPAQRTLRCTPTHQESRILKTPSSAIIRATADVAQLVEQRIRNAKVASSIPAIGTNHPNVTLNHKPAYINKLRVFY